MISNSVSLIIGPMFAGKTTELLRRISVNKDNGLKWLLVKYARDNRSKDDTICTHDNVKADAISCNELGEIELNAKHYDVIGIDEGQFFEDIHEFSDRMAIQGKHVIIAALSGTFNRKTFGNIPKVIPIAEEILKLSAKWNDWEDDASFTLRTTLSKETVVIGGAETYKPVCRSWYFKGLKNQQAIDYLNIDKDDESTFNSDYLLGAEKDVF